VFSLCCESVSRYRFGQLPSMNPRNNRPRAQLSLITPSPQPVVSYKGSDDGGHSRLAKPIEHHARPLAPVRPKMDELRPGGDEEQPLNAAGASDGPPKAPQDCSDRSPARPRRISAPAFPRASAFNLSIDCFSMFGLRCRDVKRESDGGQHWGATACPQKGRIHI